MYAIYAYIDPKNHPNVGIYVAHMECLGHGLVEKVWTHCQINKRGRCGRCLKYVPSNNWLYTWGIPSIRDARWCPRWTLQRVVYLEYKRQSMVVSRSWTSKIGPMRPSRSRGHDWDGSPNHGSSLNLNNAKHEHLKKKTNKKNKTEQSSTKQNKTEPTNKHTSKRHCLNHHLPFHPSQTKKTEQSLRR